LDGFGLSWAAKGRQWSFSAQQGRLRRGPKSLSGYACSGFRACSSCEKKNAGRIGGSYRSAGGEKGRPEKTQEVHKTVPKGTRCFKTALRTAHDQPTRLKIIRIADIYKKPTSLAPDRKMKKGRRAAAMPFGASQSAARSGGAEQRVSDKWHQSKNLQALICLRNLQISECRIMSLPLMILPGGLHIPPGRPRHCGKFALVSIRISIVCAAPFSHSQRARMILGSDFGSGLKTKMVLPRFGLKLVPV